MVANWAACWRAPPPNMYRLQPVLGYPNHDYTKKRAPAWSFVRYLAPPRPKPMVSLSPFQIQLERQQKKKIAQKRKCQKGKLVGSDSGMVGPGGQVSHWRRWYSNARRARQKDKKLKAGHNPGGASLCVVTTADKSRKLSHDESFDSGKYVVPADQTCGLCYPWIKKDTKKKPDPKDRSKRGPKSQASNSRVEDVEDQHCCVVIPPKKQECEQHSFRRIPIPLGTYLENIEWLPRLPRPPDEENLQALQSKKVTHKVLEQGKKSGANSSGA